MATYPYTRAKPVGWAYGEVLTSAQANIIDDNAASGANGAIWTDFMLGRTWVSKATHATYGYSPIWRPYGTSTEGHTNTYGGKWYSFGVSGTTTPQWLECEALGEWQTFTMAGNFTPADHGGSAVKPDGSIIICGGLGTTTGNILEASSAGFTIRNTVGTNAVKCAVWHVPSAKFVIGTNAATATNIETSSDGITWTQITGLPDTLARGAMATNGTIIVCLSSASTNACITSTTGATGSWTARTMPATVVWSTVVWDSRNSRFLAFSGSGTVMAYSADGITWTAGTCHTKTIRGASSVIGRVLIGADSSSWNVRCGHFNGTTLVQAGALTAANTIRGTAAGDNQFIVTDASGNHYRSICGGTPV